MANLAVLDASGATKYIKADGAGTNGDPHAYRLATGATDDAAAAGELFPLAGMYQSSVDDVDAGDAGRLRMTKRRALITALDAAQLTLTAASPVPSGSDIVMRYGAAVQAADLSIRDTSGHHFLIPMAGTGFRNVAVFVRSVTAFDQVATLALYMWPDMSLLNCGKLLQTALPANTNGAWFVPAGGAGSSLGEVVGAATISSGMVFSTPMLGYGVIPYFGLQVNFSVAPTTGELELIVIRST